MTCIEKLKELHPEWTTSDIMDHVDWDCPSDHMDIDDPHNCYAPSGCRACWEREYDDSIPFEFETRDGLGYKKYVQVLEKIEQRYTHLFVYRVRIQDQTGEVSEGFYHRDSMRKMLEARIDG